MVLNAATRSRGAESADRTLAKLLRDIRACRICEAYLSPRPVIHASATAKLCIVAQAPGIRVHETGISFNDPSGDRLREWMGVDRATFYDESRVAIIGVGFCFPGYDENGGDLPPRKECAEAWQDKLFATLPKFPLTLLVGVYAQTCHLGDAAKANVTAAQENFSYTSAAVRYDLRKAFVDLFETQQLVSLDQELKPAAGRRGHQDECGVREAPVIHERPLGYAARFT